jgi:hypothetical protein
MLWSLEERKKVLRVTMDRLYNMLELNLILIKPVATYNGNYNALPYNYGNSLNIEDLTLVF